jgi:ferredoxin-NADP reductase
LARTALPGRLTWQLARVVELVDETHNVRSIVLDPPDWPGHRAGQHVDVRLTAEDGYQAERSYSIASAPEDEHVVLTIERLEDGEVSPYLAAELRVGDDLELRGPIGGYFVWEESSGGPLLLVGGGSGVVPLRAIVRHRLAVESPVPVRLLYSARTIDDVIYRDELIAASNRDELIAASNVAGIDIRITLTREQPDHWDGLTGRIDAGQLGDVGWPPAERPLVYVCGPTGLVESVANALVELGHEASRVKTERFGPT